MDALGKVVVSDLFGIDVQLLEDDLGDGSLHGVVAAAVEALGVSEEVECEGEVLAAGFKLAANVGELGLDLLPFPLDGSELGLDLALWPVWVAEEIEEVVFTGVEFVKAGVKALLEGAHAALF